MSTDLTPRRLPLERAVDDALRIYFEGASDGDRFRNPWAHPPLPTLAGVLRWKLGTNAVRPRGYRARAVEVAAAGLAEFEAQRDAATRLFWIGHASFLLALDAARFVIDPIFGRAGGLVPRVTPPAAQPAELTRLSAVLVTHGHHDHFDPPALRELARAHDCDLPFVVPRGLAAALPAECRPIVELDWWEYVDIDEVRVCFVPAQHWHRRGVLDLNKCLGGGYVLEGTHRVYHSGDTGYFGGFRAIREAFGGIDAACLPLGAYEPRWFMATQHMSPEESLRALEDLGATHFVGMHWGAYDLSDEAVDAGVGTVREAARERGIGEGRLHIVRPGGRVMLRGGRGSTKAERRHGR